MSAFAELDNKTPFSAALYPLVGPEGEEQLLLVIACSFSGFGGTPGPAAEQWAVHDVDEYLGDPAASSMQFESDVCPPKPFVDVLVHGQVHAPGGRPATEVPVQLAVGDVQKTLLASGPRRWASFLPGIPHPFVTLDLVYEHAFGGTRPNGKVFMENPAGVGFEDLLPRLEDPRNRLERKGGTCPVAGFGIVGRHWLPRASLAGTYDDTWKEKRWPLLPTDLDPRHFQSAPVDQQSRTIRGGERGHIVNMSQSGAWRFTVPRLDVAVHRFFDHAADVLNPRFDTLWLEPARDRLTFLGRAIVADSAPSERGLLRGIVLGNMRPCWVRARSSRRMYLDWGGTDGLSDRPLYAFQ